MPARSRREVVVGVWEVRLAKLEAARVELQHHVRGTETAELPREMKRFVDGANGISKDRVGKHARSCIAGIHGKGHENRPVPPTADAPALRVMAVGSAVRVALVWLIIERL
jgi:hypothetical protein